MIGYGYIQDHYWDKNSAQRSKEHLVNITVGVQISQMWLLDRVQMEKACIKIIAHPLPLVLKKLKSYKFIYSHSAFKLFQYQ